MNNDILELIGLFGYMGVIVCLFAFWVFPKGIILAAILFIISTAAYLTLERKKDE